MKYVEEFRHNDELVAVLIRKQFQNRKTADHAIFVSTNERSLLLGVGHYPKNHVGPAHTHEKVLSKAEYEELLHLVRGKMRVELYGDDKINFASVVMRPGDTIHFVSGGHGFKMLSSCMCIEVIQGAFAGRNIKAML